MALERKPLDVAALSDAAKKALSGPGPLKMMAARGLAPLPRPTDMVSVLYQLSLDGEKPVQEAAQKTAAELPDKILGPALSDEGLHPHVLDFFAERCLGRPALLQAVILNKSVDDQTVQWLAERCEQAELDLIAQNETRLLRSPGIIGALYMNGRTRMSTVDRAVELAVRNDIRVPGVPAWDEVVAGVLGTKKKGEPAPPADAIAAEDQVFEELAARALAAEEEAELEGKGELQEVPDEPEEERELKLYELSIPAKIRLAMLGDGPMRAQLIRDPNKLVSVAAIRSPKVTDAEAARYSANRSLNDDVIRFIANNRDWTKMYQVKVNLVNNPKCPLPVAMKFLPFLRPKDLAQVARSKGIPSALVAQAKKLVATKKR